MENEIKLRDYFAAKVLQGIYANNDMWLNMCVDKKTVQEIKEMTHKRTTLLNNATKWQMLC